MELYSVVGGETLFDQVEEVFFVDIHGSTFLVAGGGYILILKQIESWAEGAVSLHLQ